MRSALRMGRSSIGWMEGSRASRRWGTGREGSPVATRIATHPEDEISASHHNSARPNRSPRSTSGNTALVPVPSGFMAITPAGPRPASPGGPGPAQPRPGRVEPKYRRRGGGEPRPGGRRREQWASDLDRTLLELDHGQARAGDVVDPLPLVSSS